jgi:hypothetical protein
MEPHQPILECPVSRDELRQSASVQIFGSDDRKWPGWQFDCPHCGVFIVDQIEYHRLVGYLNPPNAPGVVTTPLQTKRHRAVMAHALRRMAAAGKTPVLTDGMTLRILQEDRLPSLAEQRDNLLRWFGSEVEIGPAHAFGYDGLGARVGSASPGAFRLLLETMMANGFLQGKLGSDPGGELKLAYRGLERLEQLERATPSGYNAFMAMQFGDSTLNRIVEEHFKQAVKDTGFQLYRLDDKPEAGLIDARLRNEIRILEYARQEATALLVSQRHVLKVVWRSMEMSMEFRPVRCSIDLETGLFWAIMPYLTILSGHV